MKRSLAKIRLLSLGVASLTLLGTSCSRDQEVDETGVSKTLSAIRDDAQLNAYFLLRPIATSGFSQKLESMTKSEDNEEELDPLDGILGELGLENRHFYDFAVSVGGLDRISRLDELDTPEGMARLSVLGAIRVTRQVSADQLAAAFVKANEEMGANFPTERSQRQNLSWIRYQEPPEGPEMVMAVENYAGGTILWFGDELAIISSVNRPREAFPEQHVAQVRDLLPNINGWVSILVPEAIRNAMQGELQRQGSMFPQMRNAATIQSFGLAINVDEAFSLGMAAAFASERDAEAVNQLFGGFVLGMLKGFVFSSQEAQELSFLDDLNSRVDGTSVRMGLTVTQRDLDILQQMMEGAFTPQFDATFE